jgi:hypothetical protein
MSSPRSPCDNYALSFSSQEFLSATSFRHAHGGDEKQAIVALCPFRVSLNPRWLFRRINLAMAADTFFSCDAQRLQRVEFYSCMERQMDFDHVKRESLVHSLRDALPLSGRPRPALLAFLRARGAIGRNAPKLLIVDILDAGAKDVMCRFMIADDDASNFVAPLAQIALDRRHPLVQRLAVRRRNAARHGGCAR